METIKEITVSIGNWLRDRIVNPFFAAFIVAWLTINWRVVLVLLDDTKALEKIKWLDTRLYPCVWHWPIFGFVYPAIISLIYIFVTPPIFTWITAYYRRAQHHHKKEMLKVDQNEPVTPDEAIRLKRERSDAKLELKRETERFKALESDLLEQIEQLQQAKKDRTTKDRTTEPEQHIVSEPELPFEEPLGIKKEDKKIFSIDARKILGSTASEIQKLARHGLNSNEINTLYALRNVVLFDSEYIEKLSNSDRFNGRLIFTRLENLDLIEPNGAGTYTISALGLQVLDQFKQQGFKFKAADNVQ